MIKVRVKVPLNVRTGMPQILPDNNIGDRYYNAGDVIEVAEKTIGETYKEINTWYKLSDGAFVWGGGVAAEEREQDLVALKKQRFDAVIQNAWQFTKGEGCVVAVVDTGIDSKNLFIGANVISKGSMSFTKNTPEDALTDDDNHGTKMAGLICGADSILKIGYAPGSKVLSIKIEDNSSSKAIGAVLARIEEALVHLKDNTTVDIINLSLEFDPKEIKNDPQLIEKQTSITQTINELIGKGCIVIAASGNKDFVAFPGNIPSVVTVGVLQNGFDLKTFSNGMPEKSSTGKSIDFFMETFENRLINANHPNPQFTFSTSGLRSSEATAIFSGLVALKKARNKNYNQASLRKDIQEAKIPLMPLLNLEVFSLDVNKFLNA